MLWNSLFQPFSLYFLFWQFTALTKHLIICPNISHQILLNHTPVPNPVNFIIPKGLYKHQPLRLYFLFWKFSSSNVQKSLDLPIYEICAAAAAMLINSSHLNFHLTNLVTLQQLNVYCGIHEVVRRANHSEQYGNRTEDFHIGRCNGLLNNQFPWWIKLACKSRFWFGK